MKLTKLFTISIFVLSLLVSVTFLSYFVNLENKSFIHNTREHLEDVAESKSMLVEGYLEAKKARATDFASDGFIINSLIKLKQGGDSEKISEDLENHLIVNKMSVEDNLYEIYVLDANGNIIAESVHEEHEEEHEGAEEESSFHDDSLYLLGRSKAYAKGIFYDYEFDKIGVAFSAPITSDNESLGVVVIKLVPKGLREITIERTGFGETEEVYIVNKEGYMVTPSRFLEEEGGTLVQKIDSENLKRCPLKNEMSDSDMEKSRKREGSIVPFLNYRGEEVFGVCRHLSEIDSCILVEIGKNEARAPLEEYIKNQIIISVFLIFVFSLVGFFVGRYFDKKGIMKRSERISQDNISPFLKDLKLRYYLLFALVFASGYFVLINLFFDHIIYPLVISGLFSFAVGFLIFFYGVKLKYSKSRKYLFLGAGAIIIYHLVHIPMELYFNLVKPFNVLYWIPWLILYAFGFLFLLKFLEDSAK